VSSGKNRGLNRVKGKSVYGIKLQFSVKLNQFQCSHRILNLIKKIIQIRLNRIIQKIELMLLKHRKVF